LRQVLAEIGFQLFDPFDQGHQDSAGAFQAEIGRAQADDFVI